MVYLDDCLPKQGQNCAACLQHFRIKIDGDVLLLAIFIFLPMTPRFICAAIIALLLLNADSAKALTMYKFKYRQQMAGKEVATEALFLQHDNGYGFLKTKYIDPVSGSRILVDLQLDEEYIRDGQGGIDQHQLYIKTKNANIMLGKVGEKIQQPIFLFTTPQNKTVLEPTALINIDRNGHRTINKQAEFSAEFLGPAQGAQKELEAFFTQGDSFWGKLHNTVATRFTPDEMRTTIHLLIVADTTEEDIGKSCAHDLHRVLDTYTKVVAYMHARMRVRIIAGQLYSKRQVVSELKLLKPDANDIVVFYYSGHGYRKKEDKRQFPYIDLRQKPDDDYLTQTLNMDDIYRFIKRKGARMNLVISDCCNSYVGDRNAVASIPPQKQTSPLQLDGEHIRMLFLKAKISILATAADSTQRASSNNSMGGFFSYYLNASLEASASNSKTTVARANSSPEWWNNILSETRAQTEKKAQYTYCDKPYTVENICKQSPCFKIE